MEINEFLYKINHLSRRKVMVEFIPSGNKARISIWLCDKIILEDFTVYKILRKSMIYVYFISCFDEPLLFRLLLQRSSTVGFSASVNSVVRLPTNILFPSINMLIAAFKSLS